MQPSATTVDLHLTLGCATPPVVDDLAPQIAALGEAAFRARLLQRSPGPGFLGLDLPQALAAQLLTRLRTVGAQGEVVKSAYRQPRVTVPQAVAIASQTLPTRAAADFPGYAFDPVRFWAEGVRWWVCGMVSPALVSEGYVPGGLVAYVDKTDGHLWQPQEIEHIAMGMR